ncbi:MAG: hypothetical protein ABID35_06385, partial [Candidatus Margulisiibacteriota bacterium]
LEYATLRYLGAQRVNIGGIFGTVGINTEDTHLSLRAGIETAYIHREWQVAYETWGRVIEGESHKETGLTLNGQVGLEAGFLGNKVNIYAAVQIDYLTEPIQTAAGFTLQAMYNF